MAVIDFAIIRLNDGFFVTYAVIGTKKWMSDRVDVFPECYNKCRRKRDFSCGRSELFTLFKGEF